METPGTDPAVAEAERAAGQLKKDVKRARRRIERLVAETHARLLRLALKRPSPDRLASKLDRASSQAAAPEPVRSGAAQS
jgi:hypothetical protein